MKKKFTNPSSLAPSTSELLITQDGTILAHNITPLLAKLLSKLNPIDIGMKQRAKIQRGRPSGLQLKP
jgi:hypothetical protein